jgi:CO/xanthine dehydrogenase FAD-binding subunit
VRRLSVADFLLGVRRTALMPGELMIALHVNRPANLARSAFLKLGARRYLVISIAMAAGVIEEHDGRVAAARIAVGACSPVARRLPALEAALIGAPLDRRLGERLDPAHLAPLSPIDDIRGSAVYRSDVTATLLRRLLDGFAP